MDSERTGEPPSGRKLRELNGVNPGIPTRASIITTDGEGVEETRAELLQLGVTRIGVDHVRSYGRGSSGQEPDCSGLCGACGDGRAAVSPDGAVSPCVFTTWMRAGNVHTGELAGILTGPGMAQARQQITAGRKDDDPPMPIPCGPGRWCCPGVPDSGCTPRT